MSWINTPGEFKSIVMDGVECKMERIAFKDIQLNDVIVHVFMDADNDVYIPEQDDWHHNYKIWVGEAEEYLPTANEWWGYSRGEYSYNGKEWGTVSNYTTVQDSFGFRIASEWHDDDGEGHALYRVA